jgi:hypothetical protein
MNKKTFIKKYPNLNIILTAIAIVLIWRGVWHLTDKYFFPNNFIINNLFTVLLGLWYLWQNDHKIDELNKH